MMGSKVRQHKPVKRSAFHQSSKERGLLLNPEAIQFIPETVKLRCLRDQMIVEPLDVVHSSIILVREFDSKLVRAKVIVIGPGHYPNDYLDAQGNKGAPKGKRVQMIAGERFVPTECKVGQIVHLDGRNTGRKAFDGFYWGNRYCLHAREADVAGIEV